MDKKFFFGLVRKNGVISSPDNFSEPEYELFLINDSDYPIILKNQSFGGFATCEDIIAIATPQDVETDISIEPHSYILYTELFADSFDGVGQYQAIIEVNGILRQLEFYTSRNIGFLGSLIPYVNKYGRIIYPTISDSGDIVQS